MTSLCKVSIRASREAEEAVAALLERLFGYTPCVYTPEGEPICFVSVYSAQRAGRVSSKRKALAAGLEYLSSCGLELGPVAVTIRKVPREDWSQSWKKHFHRIQIGRRLLIRPSWDRRPARHGQAMVVLDPGLSFGTGQHPTTAFCLEQLVQARRGPSAAQSFLDIGTGSGILAISAAKLGYHPVRGIDLDATAVRIAQANTRKNRIEHRVVIAREDLTRARLRSSVQYDMICANLTDDLLSSQAERILNRLRSPGRLVLAGMLEGQFDAVQKTYEQAGLRLERVGRQSGWKSGAFVRP